MHTYATAEFAVQIGVSKTSVNHYINILEATGYHVSRNARKHREYTDKDIEIVRALIKLNKERGVKLKEAAKLVTAPGFQPQVMLPQQGQSIMPQATYDEISRSMELLATHVYGIEQQNAQLLELIQAQRTQNELLMEQNDTLKEELGSMMNHLLQQANAPAEQANRQLNRVEQQNNAIMNALNRLNAEPPVQVQAQPVVEKEKGFFAKLRK